MITFFKKNASMISKLAVHQLALAMFGLVTTFAVTTYGEKNGNYILYTTAISVFSVLFYLSLLLIAANEEGTRDQVRIDAGRMERDDLLGAKWALAAGSLNLVLGVIVLITDLIITFGGDFAAVNAIYAFTRAIAMLLQSPYLGLISLYSPNNPIVFLLVPLPAVAVCWFGYYVGTRGVMIVKGTKKK